MEDSRDQVDGSITTFQVLMGSSAKTAGGELGGLRQTAGLEHYRSLLGSSIITAAGGLVGSGGGQRHIFTGCA